MTAPRRLIDDPEANEELRQVLRGSGSARALDEVTRRRLRAKVARASVVPVVAAGWIFVKSAAAALGVVGVVATAATVTGVVDWPRSRSEVSPAAPAAAPPAPRQAPARPAPVSELEAVVPSEPEAPALNPAASSPGVVPSSSGALSAESALLERARRELRRDPALALAMAGEHARRFPRGQLTSERTLIQVEALHRAGRDSEARALGRGLLSGASGDLYRERARQLLGESSR